MIKSFLAIALSVFILLSAATAYARGPQDVACQEIVILPKTAVAAKPVGTQRTPCIRYQSLLDEKEHATVAPKSALAKCRSAHPSHS